MKKEKLLKELIAIYQSAILEIESKPDAMIQILKSTETYYGICNTSLERLNVFLGGEEWVGYYKDIMDIYWCSVPGGMATLDGVLEMLDYRLFILSMELYSGIDSDKEYIIRSLTQSILFF